MLDENDHVPLTVEPIYWVSVAENSPPKTPVVRIAAVDGDHNPRQKLTFQLKAGNPQSLFDIDPNTGNHLTRYKVNFQCAESFRRATEECKAGTVRRKRPFRFEADLLAGIQREGDRCSKVPRRCSSKEANGERHRGLAALEVAGECVGEREASI